MIKPVFLMLICSVLIPRILNAADADATPQEMKDLRAKYEADIQTAIQPIKDHYLDDLKDLLKSELDKGDVDAASIVQSEIKRMTPPLTYLTPASPYLGTTWFAENLWGADETMTLESSGNSVEDWKDDHDIRGQWKMGKDDKELVVTRADGSVYHFELDAQGKLERTENGGLFVQIKK